MEVSGIINEEALDDTDSSSIRWLHARVDEHKVLIATKDQISMDSANGELTLTSSCITFSVRSS